MEKILFRRMSIVFAGLTLLLFGIISVVIFTQQSEAAIDDLEQMLIQVEQSYENSQKSTQELTEELREEYIHKARAVDFILEHDIQKEHTSDELKQIRDLMEVTEIYLINANGIVEHSSDEKSEGLDLNNYTQDEAAVILGLLKTEDVNAVAIDMQAESLIEKNAVIYIGIKASRDEYEIVQIAIDHQILEEALKPTRIEWIISQTPSIFSKALFVVSRETGEVTGITANNDQEVNLQGADTPQKFVEELDHYTEGGLATINGKIRYMKTCNMGDEILAAYVDSERVHMAARIQLIYSFGIICIVMIFVMLVLRYHIREYVLKDLKAIEHNVQALVGSDYEVEFSTEHDTEFRTISKVLNNWRDSYRHKEDRMSRIMNAVNENVGVFECLYSIGQNFFSNNLQLILGTDNAMWQKVSRTPGSFQTYIDSLMQMEETEGCIYVNGQYLKISVFNNDDACYGMVMNKTEEVLHNKKIKEQAETDPLTGLINRNGFEKRVQMHLVEKPQQGMLLIFDLDHFKAVNDAQGHPEGDRVLRVFANALQAFFGKDDIVGRIGGDEFVVFMDENVSLQTIESKMQAFLTQFFSHLKEYHEKYGLSASVGIAYVDHTITDYESLYRCADVALYIAKDNGKNSFYVNKQTLRNSNGKNEISEQL